MDPQSPFVFQTFGKNLLPNLGACGAMVDGLTTVKALEASMASQGSAFLGPDSLSCDDCGAIPPMPNSVAEFLRPKLVYAFHSFFR